MAGCIRNGSGQEIEGEADGPDHPQHQAVRLSAGGVGDRSRRRGRRVGRGRHLETCSLVLDAARDDADRLGSVDAKL